MYKLYSKFAITVSFLSLLVGIVLGVTLSLSLLKSFSIPFQIDFFTWFSIVSFIANLILILVAQNQLYKTEKQEEKTKAQISIWVEYSKAIVTSLTEIQRLQHSKEKDILNNVALVELTASYFYGSLNRASGSISPFGYYDTDKQFAEMTASRGIKSLMHAVQPENNLAVVIDPSKPSLDLGPTAKSVTNKNTRDSKK